MSPSRRVGWILVVASTIVVHAARVEALADDGGGLVGWVESTRGVPVAGAVVSIFGKGIRGGSLLTLSDSQGQFVLPTLPAGSYTLRAIGTGHLPSAAQRITVLPNRDALFTVSLTPVGEKPAAEPTAATAEPEEDAPALREWHWLMRQKRRSVLETADQQVSDGGNGPQPTPTAPAAPAWASLGTLGGQVDFAASARGGTPTGAPGWMMPAGVGALRLQGKLADGVQWSLGGLIAESEGQAWRMATEFVLQPGGGHEIRTGGGYGAGATQVVLPADSALAPDRTVGALFVRDHWRINDRLTTTAGARYTYLGFLPDSNQADAVVEVELRGDARTLVRGSVVTRTLAPGGDLLALSTVTASPALTWARLENGLRPSRTTRLELGVDRSFHGGQLSAHAFQDDTNNLLLTTFEDGGHNPYVRNAGRVVARGLGFTLERRFGSAVNGSVSYTFGHASRSGGLPFGAEAPVARFDEAEFHDLVARLETFIVWSDTRVAAFYRVNALAERDAGRGAPRSFTANPRFDVQLTQGLPFLQPLTRADWEVLLAVRNMFYEASEGGFLDEFAVQDPPTRVVGGISVRF